MVECSRWGVLSCVEAFLAEERARLNELTDRVVRRVASTAQRRTFLMACHATAALRTLAAVILRLAALQPVKGLSTTTTAAGSQACAVPLTKLHAIARALCAVHESQMKGVDHAITAGTAFLESSACRRALSVPTLKP